MDDTFSPSHDMAKYIVIGSGESYLGNKTLVGTWTVIGESEFVQLLRNVYKRSTQHQSRRTFKHSKQSISSFFLIFYKFSNRLF